MQNSHSRRLAWFVVFFLYSFNFVFLCVLCGETHLQSCDCFVGGHEGSLSRESVGIRRRTAPMVRSLCKKTLLLRAQRKEEWLWATRADEVVEFLDLAPQINNHSTTPVALRLSTRRTAPPFASLEGGELNVFIKFVTIGRAGGSMRVNLIFSTARILICWGRSKSVPPLQYKCSFL